ncbi:unnamed protein product, partial [Candidula unifasciata]
PCKRVADGTKYGVPKVCFDYFECVNGEARYRECDPFYRFDEAEQNCVPDNNCYSECPQHIKPVPDDITKFNLGGRNVSCPYGTFFEVRHCVCFNLPRNTTTTGPTESTYPPKATESTYSPKPTESTYPPKPTESTYPPKPRETTGSSEPY